MGVVQHHAFFSIQGYSTGEIKILRKRNVLGHSGHLDETTVFYVVCYVYACLIVQVQCL